ncbi:MAG: AbrB/MazE/SpoVT family DNA-binding domain-containing protein [Oscillospiraceae bacterium]|jgi:transcriptional pleiotropic regulator of transition state genes|nr:AbrB/MazE/SpoVT family DNA-binding domain-containing protein [Oscillospiraceae bacterium]
MKSTGIMRKVDELGRIVLPKELRKALDIKEKDPLEIFVGESGEIILRKYQPACIFCDSMDDIITYKGHNVCRHCMEKLAHHLTESSDD